AVDQTVAVCHASLPGSRIAPPEYDFAAVLAQHNFAFEHVDEFILLLVPMALRGRRAWLERTDIHAEMGEAGGAAEPFARTPLHGLVERRRIAGRGIGLNFIGVD